MAIPLLNNTPTYELIVPSTKSRVLFRPFLVREQKILLIAAESQDKRQIMQAILELVQTCVKDISVNDLTTFDVDYIFTQIRAKSVGEKVELKVSCEECETANDIELNLEEVNIECENTEKIVKITDTISVKLKYPEYSTLLNSKKFFSAENNADIVMDIIFACISSIMTEDENINVRDEPREDLENFVESMTAEQFESISTFAQSMPTLKHTINFDCMNCNHHNERTLEGVDDFF